MTTDIQDGHRIDIGSLGADVGGVDDPPAWLPDGKQISFLFNNNLYRTAVSE